MNWLVEFDIIVPDFPETVTIIQKVNDTTFLVEADKLPQEWIILAKVIKV